VHYATGNRQFIEVQRFSPIFHGASHTLRLSYPRRFLARRRCSSTMHPNRSIPQLLETFNVS
jgi:hypothetical protein